MFSSTITCNCRTQTGLWYQEVLGALDLNVLLYNYMNCRTQTGLWYLEVLGALDLHVLLVVGLVLELLGLLLHVLLHLQLFVLPAAVERK